MVLYKYCSPDRVDVVQKSRIRFTPPGCFNDPFEFRPALKTIASTEQLRDFVDKDGDKQLDESIAKLGPRKMLITPSQFESLRRATKANFIPFLRALEPSYMKALTETLDREFNKIVGVLCLSEIWDSMLMWGHYCQSHEGFVVGFNSSHQFFHQPRSPKDDFGRLRKVHYQATRPVVSLMGSGALEWIDSKADIWSYEKEWRMLLTLDKASEVKNVTSGAIHLFQFPPDCVEEIVFGIKCSAATENAIRTAVAGWSRRPTIFKGEIDSTDYKLNRKPA